MKLLLTGGCGFIGSAVVRHLLRRTDHVVINVDKMTYAASEEALEDGLRHNRHMLIRPTSPTPRRCGRCSRRTIRTR